MNQARAIWAMLTVAATYLSVTGAFTLLAFVGLVPWTEASEVVEAFSALSSLGVGGVRLPSSIDSFGRQNASLVFSDFGQNPNDFINTDGRLVNDRPVEFKTSLVYEFPFNLMLAAGWRLQSGKPWARTVRPEGTGLVTEILAEQIDGSRRVSTWNLLDLRAQYAIELGGGTNVAFFGDVFNLFNEDANEEVLSTLGTSESFDFPSFFVLPRRLMLGAKFRF